METSKGISFLRNLRPLKFLVLNNSLSTPNQSEIYFWEVDYLLFSSIAIDQFFKLLPFFDISMVLSQLSSVVLIQYFNKLTSLLKCMQSRGLNILVFYMENILLAVKAR